ncbi:MAG: TlpA disulfide reductase family protein [Candidatus Woykebacteria bacterium]
MRNAFLIMVSVSIVIAIVGAIALSSNQPGLTGSNSASNSGTEVGNRTPDFTLTDIEKRKISLDGLTGKPAIIWFTASYCVPCQIGAKEVRRLDEDLGGDKFNVLMVFIDPRETEKDLRDWQDSFGSKDWLIAFANKEITDSYEIRFLDTQYLLDKEGIIRNLANSPVGYEAYKSKIEELLQ